MGRSRENHGNNSISLKILIRNIISRLIMMLVPINMALNANIVKILEE